MKANTENHERQFCCQVLQLAQRLKTISKPYNAFVNYLCSIKLSTASESGDAELIRKSCVRSTTMKGCRL